MSSVSFDNYTTAARAADLSNLAVAGRYPFQADAEGRIVADVAQKLDLQPNDSLLEIGCGPGNLLVPLARMVRAACGIDNPAAIERLRARADTMASIRTISGSFLDLDSTGRPYDKILVYGVIQYLASCEQATAFVNGAASLLAPHGRLLVGDLPNVTKKSRFLKSATGQRVSTEWADLVAGVGGHPLDALPADPSWVTVEDEFVLHLLALFRSSGYEAYLLPQPPDLPFGWTREDLLVVAQG